MFVGFATSHFARKCEDEQGRQRATGEDGAFVLANVYDLIDEEHATFVPRGEISLVHFADAKEPSIFMAP